MRTSISRKGFIAANIALLSILSLLTAYPVLYVIFASFSNPAAFLAHKGLLYKPAGFSLETYKLVFENRAILHGYINTIIVVVGGVIVNMLMTSIGAYFLSRKGVMWRDPIMMMIVFTMFFGGGLVPYYLTVTGIGLQNTLLALIIPPAVSTFNLILMRTSFMSIPDEITESATMDGASHLTVLFRIVLPLSLPIMAVMVLFYGVGHWNAWFNAMIFIRDRSLYPLQLVLRELLVVNNMDAMLAGADSFDKGLASETLKYSVIVVATVPVLALYPFLQKYFIKGMMIGALKG